MYATPSPISTASNDACLIRSISAAVFIPLSKAPSKPKAEPKPTEEDYVEDITSGSIVEDEPIEGSPDSDDSDDSDDLDADFFKNLR